MRELYNITLEKEEYPAEKLYAIGRRVHETRVLSAAVLQTKGMASAPQQMLHDSDSSSSGKVVKWTNRYLIIQLDLFSDPATSRAGGNV